MNAPRCTLTVTHCEQCGSTDHEDIDPFANDGYSSCCNEIIASPGSCRGHHLPAAR